MMQEIPKKFLNEDANNIFYRCVEDSSEAIMITDTRGILRYVNPAWIRIYGYSKQETLGNTPGLLHSGKQDRKFYDEMWAKIRNPDIGSWKGELVNKSKTGELIPVLLNVTPFRNPDDPRVILGYMGMAIDIRERKLLEAEVLRQDRLASIGMIASGLAHEIGTPMGVIRGRAELLQMQSGTNEMLSSGLTTIIQQIDRIYKLMSSLLRFSRSSDDVQVHPANARELVNEVKSLLVEKLRKADIEFENLVPDRTVVSVDFNRMQQILMNLIINSIHAIETRKKSSASENFQGKITIENSQNRSHSILAVVDNGCGIAPEHISRLFQPFFTTKDIGEGTGLGLAVVSKLLAEMGGNISVESLPGEGTRFYIYLRPAAETTL